MNVNTTLDCLFDEVTRALAACAEAHTRAGERGISRTERAHRQAAADAAAEAVKAAQARLREEATRQ